MQNSYKSPLNRCMDALNITAKQLSQAIYVDHTLISKWVNGKRVVNTRSAHLNKIVDYLIIAESQTQQKVLKDIIAEQFGKKALNDIKDLAPLLSCYLTQNFEQKTGKKNSEFKASLGDKGRRSAVLDLLDHVLASKNKKQLLLVSQEDMSWLTGDGDFLNKWEQKLKKVLQGGNKITIIHWVDRHPEALAAIYSKWLPMHLTGNLTSYYMPLYPEINQKQTLFIVSGDMVIYGYCLNDESKLRYTATYYDSVSNGHYERVYLSMLNNCTKLFTEYSFGTENTLWEAVQAGSAKPGKSYIIADTPYFITLPEEILRPLLEENNIDQQLIKKCVQFSQHASINETNGYMTCIFSLDKLEELSKAERFLCPELSYITGKEIYATNTHFKKLITYMANKLFACPNYEICLLSGDQKNKILPVNLWAKYNVIAVGWATLPPYAVSVTEPTLVSAGCQFISAAWERIPRVNRDRNETISILTNFI